MVEMHAFCRTVHYPLQYGMDESDEETKEIFLEGSYYVATEADEVRDVTMNKQPSRPPGAPHATSPRHKRMSGHKEEGADNSRPSSPSKTGDTGESNDANWAAEPPPAPREAVAKFVSGNNGNHTAKNSVADTASACINMQNPAKQKPALAQRPASQRTGSGAAVEAEEGSKELASCNSEWEIVSWVKSLAVAQLIHDALITGMSTDPKGNKSQLKYIQNTFGANETEVPGRQALTHAIAVRSEDICMTKAIDADN
eukprot:6211916-Pleurochrysis_carterae.AAC.6